VNVNEGTLYFASSNGNLANNTALTVAAGATFAFRVVNDTCASLSGARTVKGTTLSNLGIATGPRIVVGVDNSTTTFSGSILGTGVRFDKQGTGQMTLSGANTFDGFVTVQAGKLRLEGGQ